MRGKAVPAADGTVAPQAASQANGHTGVHQLAAAAADSRGTGAAGRAAQVRDADVAVMPPLVPIVKAASSSAYHVKRIQGAGANSRALCVLDLEGHRRRVVRTRAQPQAPTFHEVAPNSDSGQHCQRFQGRLTCAVADNDPRRQEERNGRCGYED